jgi:hypothetical protein
MTIHFALAALRNDLRQTCSAYDSGERIEGMTGMDKGCIFLE